MIEYLNDKSPSFISDYVIFGYKYRLTATDILSVIVNTKGAGPFVYLKGSSLNMQRGPGEWRRELPMFYYITKFSAITFEFPLHF